MQYLNKFLFVIKKTPLVFKTQDLVFCFGLTLSQIKSLKKYALDNLFIEQKKDGCFLTSKGEEYLVLNPLKSWNYKEFSLRPEVNLELLKEEKTPSILTKAIRSLARYLLEKQVLKDYSIEHVLLREILNCKNLLFKIELDILSGESINLEKIYIKYFSLGITKSIISLLLLKVFADNLDKIAIYEKGQFQITLNQLMFDRIMACPQNFVIKKTEMPDEYLLKDISKIILNKKSNNILEITKGLYAIIKSLDKYTMNTQNLTAKTLRLRNVIIGAKDPISLFEKDIPRVLNGKSLKNSERELLDSLKKSLNEMNFCTENLIKDLRRFILETFNSKSKDELCQRFIQVKDYIGESELKVLMNNVMEINIADDLWTKRIATYINKFRVPKDWSDEDYANFKLKTKELALKFFVIEATAGIFEFEVTNNYKTLLDSFLKLSKREQLVFLRNCANIR